MPNEPHRDAPYAENDERPPWIEEAADPTYWDVAFGSYGDGYLEWVTNRFYWDDAGARTVADTRSLWSKRNEYFDDPLIVELNARREDTASNTGA